MINPRPKRIMIDPIRVHIDLFGCKCNVKSDNVPPTKPIIAPLAPTETFVGMNKAENKLLLIPDMVYNIATRTDPISFQEIYRSTGYQNLISTLDIKPKIPPIKLFYNL